MSLIDSRMLRWAEETPSGTINGSNQSFSLASTPDSKTLVLSLDGLCLKRTTDYTISGTTITMVLAPATGQNIYAIYRKAN
jgi:hypothetical protein